MGLNININVSYNLQICNRAVSFKKHATIVVIYSQKIVKNWQSNHTGLTSSLTLHFYFHVFVTDINVFY